jgi:hypothetical protein
MLARLIAILLISLSTAAYGYDVEGWDVRQFPDERNPLGCIMGGTFQDGTRLSVIVMSDKLEWAIGLSNQSWRLAKGKSTDVAAYVDRRFIASGKAEHFTDKIAILPLGGVAAYQALRAGHRLDIQTPYGNLNFQLKGTAKAMMAVVNCASSLRPQPNQQTAQQQPSPNFALVPQAELATLVTNLLNSAGATGYRLDPPNPDQAHVSYLLGDGTRGTVVAARGQTKSADDYTGVVIARASQQCAGEFVSAKKAVPSVDGSVVREVLTTCRSNGAVSATETTIIRQPHGFLIELSHSVSGTQSLNSSPALGSARSSVIDAAMSLPAYR